MLMKYRIPHDGIFLNIDNPVGTFLLSESKSYNHTICLQNSCVFFVGQTNGPDQQSKRLGADQLRSRLSCTFKFC